MFRLAVSAATNGDNSIIPAPTNKQCIAVISYHLTPDGDNTMKWQSKGSGATDLSGAMTVIKGVAPPGNPISPNPGQGNQYILLCKSNEALNLVLTTTAGLRGTIEYDLVPEGYSG